MTTFSRASRRKDRRSRDVALAGGIGRSMRRLGSMHFGGALLAVVCFAALCIPAQAQQQTPQQKRQTNKQAAPLAAPKAQPASPLTPAALAQLNQDIETCRTGQDLASLERTCSNVLRQLGNISNIDSNARGQFYFNRSKGRINARDFPSAIEDLRRAISEDYNQHIAYATLGTVYLNHLADRVQAEASFQKALELDPGYRDARLGLAITLLRKPDVAGAVREINTALTRAPQDAELHYQKAIALSQGTSLDDAMKSLDEALRLRPGYVDALVARFQLNMDRGQNTRAVEDLDAIVASNPSDSLTLARLGLGYGELKRYERAIEICERSIRLDVKNVTAHVCLGYAHTNRGEIQTAEDDFERALQWDNASANAFIGRGYLRKRSGNFPSAIADFKRALEIEPKSSAALHNLISVYTDNGELDKALLAFEEAININRKDAEALYLRSFVKALKNDAAGARRDVDQAFGYVGNANSDAYLARAAMNYFLSDTVRAVADAREAVRINQDNGQAWRLLARALIKRNDLAGAETALKRAQALLPNDWNVIRTWGFLELARRNFEVAKDHLDRSIELNPAFVESYVARGRAYDALRNPDLAVPEYRVALTKLDYDNDGRDSREEAKKRLAAPETTARVAPPALPPTPPKKTEPQVAALPEAQPVPPPQANGEPARPRSVETRATGASDSLMCRMFKNWADHARDYTGVLINPGCR